ncbi:MAG: MaoC family dehydratase N-terminal domain-containing protein [Rhodobacteraceae bacterium]|jgi:3-methylfumaryl-CoA hydratase|nr:MaoC family dehydratase N-terminal domain-containing protein [Paracoccaceae bacterium]
MTEAGWQDWVGRSTVARDVATVVPARALAATLDRADAVGPGADAELPPLWLWLYFLPLDPTAELGPDGHARRGRFLPPVAPARRMWAGSRCRFAGATRLGESLERRSTILRIAEKAGRAGPMVFVTVHHAIAAAGRPVMEEEQDIVYLPIPDRWQPPPAVSLPAHDWSEAVAIDPVLLFRFSALTFNGHRIHYDRRHATEVEHYPGLVVHGPLQAVLLMDAALRRAGGRRAGRFTFRGLRPLFDHDGVGLHGRHEAGGMALWTAAGGAVGMEARLEWG